MNTVKRSVAGCLQLLIARSRYRARHEALSSGGLDSQSNAFFRTPGIEFLYSGVAIKRPSVAAILVFNSCTMSTWPLAKLKIELEKIRKELGVAAERRRKYDLLKRKVDTDALALKKLDAAITHAGGAVGRRKTALEERKAAYRGIFDTFGEEENTLKLLYEPLHGEFAEAEGALSKLKFSVTRRVDLKSWVKTGELLFDLRKDPFRDQGGLLQEATAKLLPVWRSAPDAIASSIRERDIRRANLRRFPYHFLFRGVGHEVRILVVRHHHRYPSFGSRRR